MKKRWTDKRGVAFLWDESFLWGLMAYKTLRSLGLPFDLIRSEDIRMGHLKRYRMLFVPGGWASNKIKALKEDGIEEIKRFVYEGGNYFGICGGAGLATLDGIGLLNIKRMPKKQRVPSFSGRICLNINGHHIWEGIDKHPHEVTDSPPHRFTALPIFHAWWPSQFIINDRHIRMLATFGDALDDSFSSDLNVSDVRLVGDWAELEKLYGINLDPARLKDEPAVVEGRYGEGKVLLSLIHFDTPGDEKGTFVLKNIWEYLGNMGQESSNSEFMPHQEKRSSDVFVYCSRIIEFGIRNLLWFWRTPMLLQWRRGVRGLEYCTLYIMAKELIDLGHDSYGDTSLLSSLSFFSEKAIKLLMLERQAMQKGMITYEYSDNPEIQTLRKELFGISKSHGGLFKEILDKIDLILYESLIKKQAMEVRNPQG